MIKDDFLKGICCFSNAGNKRAGKKNDLLWFVIWRKQGPKPAILFNVEYHSTGGGGETICRGLSLGKTKGPKPSILFRVEEFHSSRILQLVLLPYNIHNDSYNSSR